MQIQEHDDQLRLPSLQRRKTITGHDTVVLWPVNGERLK
jgi:hypothetical protein